METILNGEEIIRDKIIQDESLENVRKLDNDKVLVIDTNNFNIFKDDQKFREITNLIKDKIVERK